MNLSTTYLGLPRIDRSGADGLALFNRFYQPDVDVETMAAVPRLDNDDRSLWERSSYIRTLQSWPGGR